MVDIRRHELKIGHWTN